jgi:hypothetical protein
MRVAYSLVGAATGAVGGRQGCIINDPTIDCQVTPKVVPRALCSNSPERNEHACADGIDQVTFATELGYKVLAWHSNRIEFGNANATTTLRACDVIRKVALHATPKTGQASAKVLPPTICHICTV